MLTEERRAHIAKLVAASGSVASDELAERFDVTRMTIYRDLKILEEAGELRRVRGGAVSEGAEEPLFASKRSLHGAEKAAIARYVAEVFVEDDDTLLLEAGTTAVAVLRHLAGRRLTVVTNGLEALGEAAKLIPEVTVIATGGILRERSLTFVGPQTEAFLRGVHARLFLMSCSGFTLEQGITDPNPLEVQVKRAMAASASRTVLMLDGSKFGRYALLQILDIDEISALVTDEGAPEDQLAALRARGVEVHVVPLDGGA